MKIAVGLSGGVDSSVAAALLQEQGHEVVGVTMKLWRDGRYRGGDKDACFGPGEAADIERAAALCRKLDIAYHVFDCSEEYEKVVLEYFRTEYLAGKTHVQRLPKDTTLQEAMNKFLKQREKTLSPSTYRSIWYI